MLKESQKQDILRLRSHGWGYRKIACAVDASRDQVRNFCKSNSVAGKGIDLVEKNGNSDVYYCKMCGTALIQNKTGRRSYIAQKIAKRIGKSCIRFYMKYNVSTAGKCIRSKC